ncbi:MAG: esterase [Bacteroidetes bacterium]|jgi:predicted esterase|nr:esterase [Bacteroidota bacterium]
MTEHHLTVHRTARYHTLGPEETPDAVWFVLHGYGQLAAPFLRGFAPVDDGRRLFVAPEALSRFYLPGHERVGASWMTKADRETEIGDYLAYLDALAEHLRAPLPDDVPVHVLGFSQGATTACRWAVLGATPVERVVLWAGGLPHDLDYDAHAETLRALDVTLVAGTEDEYVTPERLAEQQALLDDYAIPYRHVSFDGPHRLDAETLRRVVG